MMHLKIKRRGNNIRDVDVAIQLPCDAASNYFFFALTFCVNADAAADFASLLAVLLLRIFAAADATFLLVCSVLPFCVRADAATDFSALVAVLLLRTFAALDATFLLVLSDLAIG